MKRIRFALLLVLAVFSLSLIFAANVFAATVGAPVNGLTIATALVVAWGYLAPLTVYKWWAGQDSKAKAVTILASVVIAVVALLLGDGIRPDLSSAAGVYGFALVVYGEQQLVWTLFKDHPATTKAVN